MDVQVFGTRKCSDTRKALRFFAERRVTTHFVDLKERPASPGELRRFARKFGALALVDREGPLCAQLGLRVAHLSEDQWLGKLVESPLLLRTPLVRCENRVTVGLAEEIWREWMGAGSP